MINIARDFSPYPAGRFMSDGPGSGEEFRDKMLLPALEGGEHVTVIIDGVKGMPVSFMEEAFGGLIRTGRFTYDRLREIMTVSAEAPQYKRYTMMIWDFIKAAKPANAH